ncbi:uncharacterized protein YgbK (DUF1537 family) [Microbacterium sp. SORGH_AS 1204]|uniref:four-carbon acid sugar kinase family protein n=1 Tax=Microbacterium sp. SORGH_AS_1204 TaxID=3041785 RepID=UPI00278F3BC9|nr:four-carbon acid sugar kinase family protein [Microbacterium sp. SORGH_AS_1204]MDQ1135503.1 uncharacterized protein YgbK (DUF1537 family) [Microbacterium sp. SORGH_AS_1204]
MIEAHALRGFPAPLAVAADEVRSASAALGSRLVVLDDDPTGTQSVADLPVLTAWDATDFAAVFATDAPAVYVLTNARSLGEADARTRNREVAANALAAAREAGVDVEFVSRGDSTLRGHFPLETDTLAETIVAAGGAPIDGVLIVPAFPDAGRVTIGGVHYMREGDELRPIGETEFARDATFGYSSSDLAEWVAEKSDGRHPAASVIVIDLSIVRAGAEAVADAIQDAEDRTPIVCDVVTEDDLRLLSLGLIEARRRGKNLLSRVGPPFVRARIGAEQRAPLTTAEAFPDGGAQRGGLIVVGSHVAVTTRQLTRLRAVHSDITDIEIDVARVLDPTGAPAYLRQTAADVAAALDDGDVVVSTSRTVTVAADADASLEIARTVSSAVVQIVQDVVAQTRPRFVVAKGGITSSDVAARGLSMRRATVLGPMLPGIISLWEPVDGPAVGVPYVVFAGNVGDDDALAHVVSTLTRTPAATADR